MPGINRGLKSNYSIETNEGFARLSRMAGRNYDWPPLDSGNVNEDIMLDAVYGGAVNPNAPQEFAVYSIDWLDEHPEDVEELEEVERIPGEPVEDFARRLDETFSGWVYNTDREEVYVLIDQTEDSRAGGQTRRRE
ncbi:MAG: hypothetical protein ACLFVJ_07440 [Persicimonas sp.]